MKTPYAYRAFTVYGRTFQSVPLRWSHAVSWSYYPGDASTTPVWAVPRSHLPGCPIRISRDQGLFAPPPGFSQLITSFFASESPGIHRLPLLTFFTRHFRAGLISLSSLFFSCSFQFPACQRSFLVENNGFEPLTLCVQSRCSSQLS